MPRAKKTKAEPKRWSQKVIWTIGYRPFILGGSCYYNLGSRVRVTGPHDIGHGYKAYLATSPNGRTFVVEATSLAIVGPTLVKVRQDIETGDPKMLKKQVADAIVSRKSGVEVVTTEKFWNIMESLRG